MNASVKNLNKWANAHTYYSVDVMRILLGAFLIGKGISFITNNREFEDILSPLSNFLGGMMVFHYVAVAHIMGGVMLVFGLLTRWCIMAQLPILLGAVLVNFIGVMHFQNLVISVITFSLSLFFLIYGSGKHSADYYFKMQK